MVMLKTCHQRSIASCVLQSFPMKSMGQSAMIPFPWRSDRDDACVPFYGSKGGIAVCNCLDGFHFAPVQPCAPYTYYHKQMMQLDPCMMPCIFALLSQH